MMALAPNATVLLGELVAARLIAHAGFFSFIFPYRRQVGWGGDTIGALRFLGNQKLTLPVRDSDPHSPSALYDQFADLCFAGSLINLAKYPSSTVQILGAEKALFRALKTKKDTPKYGLIYHAQLIGQTPGKLKGKVGAQFNRITHYVVVGLRMWVRAGAPEGGGVNLA